MTLYLDSADFNSWDELMPLGIFKGITTNPILAAKAGLDYKKINWADMVKRASDHGAFEFYAQVYGSSDTYIDWAGELYEIGKKNGIETIIKIPLVETAIQQVASIKSLGGRILMTACYDAKQMLIAKSLKADFIAPYFGRMNEAGIDALHHLSLIAEMNKNSPHKCEVLVASIRDVEQMIILSKLGHNKFTISPSVAKELIDQKYTIQAYNEFESSVLKS